MKGKSCLLSSNTVSTLILVSDVWALFPPSSSNFPLLSRHQLTVMQVNSILTLSSWSYRQLHQGRTSVPPDFSSCITAYASGSKLEILLTLVFMFNSLLEWLSEAHTAFSLAVCFIMAREGSGKPEGRDALGELSRFTPSQEHPHVYQPRNSPHPSDYRSSTTRPEWANHWLLLKLRMRPREGLTALVRSKH